MRRTFILLIVASLMMISCDTMTRNGKLDGMWQYLSITYHTATGADSVVNIKDDKVYMMYGENLGQISPGAYRTNSMGDRVLMRFHKRGRTLELYDFTVYREEIGPIGTERHSVEVVLTDSASTLLAPFGVDGISARFHIKRLDGAKMELTSSSADILLRKF